MDVHHCANAVTVPIHMELSLYRFVHKRVRERRKHAWNDLPSKSALYTRAEKGTTYCMSDPLLLRRNQMDRDLNVIHKICLEQCQATEVALPLSEKIDSSAEHRSTRKTQQTQQNTGNTGNMRKCREHSKTQ